MMVLPLNIEPSACILVPSNIRPHKVYTDWEKKGARFFGVYSRGKYVKFLKYLINHTLYLKPKLDVCISITSTHKTHTIMLLWSGVGLILFGEWKWFSNMKILVVNSSHVSLPTQYQFWLTW